MITQEKGGLKDKDYLQAMLGWVEVCSRQDFSESTTLGVLLAKLEFIDRHITPSSLAEFLTDRYVTDYVNVNGIDSLERILPYYETKVKNKEKRNRFRQLCELWQHKAPGALALDFNYVNIDSAYVRLSDFKGNFVYLCFWNTACHYSAKSLLALK